MTKKIHLLSIVAIAAVLIAGSLAVSPMAFAGDDDDDDDDNDATTCVGVLAPGTYDDIVVESGNSCTFVEFGPLTITVNGDIEVEEGASLLAAGFAGSVTVNGSIESEGAAGIVLSGISVGGDVEIDDSTGLAQVGSTAIGGSLTMENNSGDAVRAFFNTISGDVEIEENTPTGINFPMLVAANTIGGDLECEDNNPAPTLATDLGVGANIVSGDEEEQCTPPMPPN